MRMAIKMGVYFLIAVMVGGIVASILQTQLNMVALASISPNLPFSVRLETTGIDLINVSPLLIGILFVVCLVAFPIAAWLSHLHSKQRLLWFVLAGAIGLGVAFQIIDAMAPMPTLIAATRTLAGTAVMLLAGATSGALFAYLTKKD